MNKAIANIAKHCRFDAGTAKPSSARSSRIRIELSIIYFSFVVKHYILIWVALSKFFQLLYVSVDLVTQLLRQALVHSLVLAIVPLKSQ